MKYIVGLLFVITIMHDVRIYRLNRNVEVLTAFFDEAVRRLKEFEDKHLAETKQTEYDKYREKIRAHDPHKDWFEDEQTDCPWK